MTQDRPLGTPVPDWTPPPRPASPITGGARVRLDPLEPEAHAALLHQAFEGADWLWDYMPYGPFSSAAQYYRWMQETVADPGHLFFAVIDLATDRPCGVTSYLRIAPAAGSIEVGNICLSPQIQRSPAATEAMYLMMKWAFESGYRRYEWKCNALNLPSRRAAERLGFSYEGVFRQATVVKGHNRDTAWFACIDSEWPALKETFRIWLDPANFDAEGRQKERLSDLTRLVRVTDDPALAS